MLNLRKTYKRMHCYGCGQRIDDASYDAASEYCWRCREKAERMWALGFDHPSSGESIVGAGDEDGPEETHDAATAGTIITFALEVFAWMALVFIVGVAFGLLYAAGGQ